MFTRKLLTQIILVFWGSLISYSTSARHFVQNVGQVTDQYLTPRTDIDFKLSATNGLNIFIDAGKIYYQFAKQGADSTIIDMYRMDVELLGANPNPKVITDGKAGHYERYYTNGLDGAIAQKISKITYLDVYPGIDLLLYFTKDGQLEYDFVVRPKGKISDIKIKYSGVEEVKINADGSLTARTPFGSVTENAPYAYQQEDKKRVSTAFMIENNIVSFSAADYKGTLVIDPILEWATYFGGTEWDAIQAMAYGKDGFIYAVGNTNSMTNIVTSGAFQVNFGGGNNSSGSDVFLTRFDTTGMPAWSTYYGGTRIDNVREKSITTDTNGSVYIVLSSSSSDMATVGVHQEAKAGSAASYDAVLAKFDTLGQRDWATYYGGTGIEGDLGLTITCDKNNNIFIAGNTASTAGIATSGTHQTTRAGSGDGFIAQFSTAGQRIWGTYFGGTSSIDVIRAITTDKDGNIYIAGHTNSTDGIATSATHQNTNNGGPDAFIAKFSPTGQQLWGTYFGGTGHEETSDIKVDTSGFIYLTGLTTSTSDISTANVHQTIYGGGMFDIFLSRFNSNGTLSWSTYFGGNANDYNAKILLHTDNKIYLSGTTNSPDGIATNGAIKPTYNQSGEAEILLTTFDTTGQQIWGTYLGGSSSEWNMAILEDNTGNIYLSGYTASPDLSTVGAYQEWFGGNRDGYLLKVNMCFLPQTPDSIFGPLEVCGKTSVTYHVDEVEWATAYEWILPTGWDATSTSDSISIMADRSGTIKVVAINDCGQSDTIQLDVLVLHTPEPVINRNGNILSVTQLYPLYQWNRNGQAITGADQPTYAVTENGNYTLTVSALNGCNGTSDPIEVTNLSISGTENELFTLFPNPASNSVNISTVKPAVCRLYDITGRRLMTTKLSSGNNNINISGLPDNMYIVRIYDEYGSIMGEGKLLIQATE